MNIPNFNKCHVLVVGDLMLDEYVWGDVDRISPEAPVQIVSVQREDYTLGGAGNVVNNLVALGANVSVAGVIGDRSDGKRLIEKFNDLGADTGGVIRETGRLTTRKTRIIAAHQHVLRIDRETKKDISGQTLEFITEFIEKKIPVADVVLISDYGKGLITKALLKSITAAAKKHKKITIADPKGFDFSKYAGISLLTPNKKEAALASGIEITDESDLLKSGHKIFEIADIDNLLITCGKDGMVLFDRNRSPHQISAQARQVYDVSGAGDTVVAMMGLAAASGLSFEEGAALANTAAGIVVGKVGTATVSREELILASHTHSDHSLLKHKSLSDLPTLIQELKNKGKQIVLTNGCFDLLHAGHIVLFSASKQLGDVLIVAIDDDASVSAIKGPGRPVISAKERVRILSALDSVDYVIIFSSEQLKTLIEIIKPDILTKGSNYTSEKVVGHELVEQFGGRVVLFPVSEKISSTHIINTIKSNDAVNAI
ncbi:D-glycero-beta-D-manno-heptose-7-phosphate kinase [Desulfonema magnum]|uniref:Bifunctional protein HldE n=1 Tax=Desulfonema magnum TaxID=45655 RepID=A0A975GU60_9BACT|nr:D-glycero-beta-D-manno-heptose-7-phosphate kinase [Desulfonema magnum]QTA93702.1 Bifunctional protein RfaE domain I domain-containing protein [Desulfonema magnum]